MPMTAEEVIEKLKAKGFTVMRNTEITDEHIVIHRGEQVACIYDTYVCIAKHYPSINPNGTSTSYADADKFVIMFSHPISEVDTAVQWLLESPARIDRLKRQNRVDTVRRYFDDRRSASLDDRRSRLSGDDRPSLSSSIPLTIVRIVSSYTGHSSRDPSRLSTLADDD